MPDSQTLGLVIAAMVAGLVCLRLYWVLGRRTGQEPQPRPAQTLTPPPPQVAPLPGPSSGGLVDIQLADRDFDTPKFLAGAREAYGRIVTAFAAGDVEALRPLLSPDVLAAFEAGIKGRTGPAAPFVKLTDAKIVAATLEGRHAEITVSFTAEFSGGADSHATSDVWTFGRSLDSADPNWTLVATSGAAPE